MDCKMLVTEEARSCECRAVASGWSVLTDSVIDVTESID